MWAAKQIQTKIAVKNAIMIRAALKVSANRKQIAEQFEAVDLQPSSSPTQDNAWVRSWALMNVKIDTKPLKKAVERSVAEGWVTGQKAADHTIKYAAQRLHKASVAEIVSDPNADVWKGWKPGDAATAALLARPYGLQILLATAEKDIRGIERTLIDQIGTRLAEGKRQGLSIQDMADSLSGVIDNPARALTIATTEVSRAVNTSAQTRYQEAKLTKNQWMGIDPCDTCAMNDGEIVEIGAPFASGDTQPPAHPNCLCTLLPVISKEDFVDRTEEATAATDALFEESVKREEELTPVMMAVSQATSGTISGLRFRLKQPKSLRRKIVDQVEKGEYATAAESAANVSDAVRYTISYDSKNYVKSVASTIDDMRTRGYELRVKNYWDRADYKGINIAVKDKTGKTFELQLHTKESLAIKDDLHALYEQYRESKNDAQRWKLWNEMVGIAKKIPNPEGFSQLLKIGTLKYEQFTDSKGVVRRAGEGLFKPVKIPDVKLPPVETLKPVAPIKPADVTYRGSHMAPDIESGAPLHNIAANDIYPTDVYQGTNVRLYGSGYPEMDKKIHELISKVKGNPEAEVTVYRAVPKNAVKPTITSGDWITPIKEYAVQHGESNLGNDYQIIAMRVKAKDVYTSGDSLLEWGYSPATAMQPIPVTTQVAQPVDIMFAANRAVKVENQAAQLYADYFLTEKDLVNALRTTVGYDLTETTTGATVKVYFEKQHPDLKGKTKEFAVLADAQRLEMYLKNKMAKQGFEETLNSGTLRPNVVEELKKAETIAKEKTTQAMQTGNVTIAIKLEDLFKVFKDKRFKNQFETMTSNGMLDDKFRKVSEAAVQNIPVQAAPTERSIYGYITTNEKIQNTVPDEGFENGIKRLWDNKLSINSDAVDQYGDIRIVLKPEVKQRTTVTIGDSLYSGKLADKITSPNPDLINMGLYDNGVSVHTARPTFGYMEAQIQGIVTVDDIAMIYVPKGIDIKLLGDMINNDGINIPIVER
jgi:hypothetical protein